MRLINRDTGLGTRKHVRAKLCGVGIHELVLDEGDFANLSNMKSEELEDWVSHLYMRFTRLQTTYMEKL